MSDAHQDFRSAIAAFIAMRKEEKLKDKDDGAGSAARYEYTTWLEDAARRASWISIVTHVLKATHPDARGSSLYVSPADLPSHEEIGSHVLGNAYAEDVVGNAAALDVFKFLKLEVKGRSLLYWMTRRDPDLRRALHEDPAVADAWMESFSGLIRSDPQPASHVLAKQLYWCVGDHPADDADYHLLQPLTSSSLMQSVHEEINDSRFGETNKEARQAFREGKPSNAVYRHYPGLAVRKLGGTKPQNISQLNSERRGVNYLLASLPPLWKQNRMPPPRHSKALWGQFSRFGEVQELMERLKRLLLSDPDANAETRNKRSAIETAIVTQLQEFAATVRARFEPGWTKDEGCELAWCEQRWLDPERVEIDEEFAAMSASADWQEEVAGRFADWMNERLREYGLTAVGDVEHRHWARQAILEGEE